MTIPRFSCSAPNSGQPRNEAIGPRRLGAGVGVPDVSGERPRRARRLSRRCAALPPRLQPASKAHAIAATWPGVRSLATGARARPAVPQAPSITPTSFALDEDRCGTRSQSLASRSSGTVAQNHKTNTKLARYSHYRVLKRRLRVVLLSYRAVQTNENKE